MSLRQMAVLAESRLMAILAEQRGRAGVVGLVTLRPVGAGRDERE